VVNVASVVGLPQLRGAAEPCLRRGHGVPLMVRMTASGSAWAKSDIASPPRQARRAHKSRRLASGKKLPMSP